MKNRKETLIKTLYGSLDSLKNLPDLILEETIYDEKGYVDCEFMTAILTFMQKSASIQVSIQKALNKLLGIDDQEPTKKGKEDLGKKWTVEEILKHCTLDNNILKLPNVQFNRKSYAEAKKWIEEAGGKWEGGSTQGFKFDFDAKRVFSILNSGKRCNLKQDFQFFATPDDVSDWLVGLAGGISDHDKVLEPSAGTGSLIKAIHRSCPNVVVDCYELMPENKEILSKLGGIHILGDDFTTGEKIKYTKIIANPPFSKNQDIRHVRLMYDLLECGGTLASITSNHWRFAVGDEEKSFREWLENVKAKVFPIEKESFKESGTNIETNAIVITK